MKDPNLSEMNERFIRQVLKEEPEIFEQLKEGQAPDFFVLACCDSRVSPSVVTHMPLGHMFVHRNIGNQVVESDKSFTASLYYALKQLGIKRIIIKGHTGCGGVAAAWAGNEEPDLKDWIAEIRGSLPEKQKHPELPMEELVRENVLKQVEKLKNHPVYKQYGQGVEIYGCLFQIETGKLERIISHPISPNLGYNEPIH